MKILFAMFAFIFAASACAQEDKPKPVYKPGKEYTVLKKPVRTLNPGKIEVTEFFWYGCGHCNTFEPILNRWIEKQADDIALVKSPAVWNASMGTHAQILFTAKALKVFDKVHPAVFEAMHKDRKRLISLKEIEPLFTAVGVSAEKFNKTFSSFGVKSQVQQADSRARSAGITGTPEILVDGRFLVSGTSAGSHAKMLQVVDFLIEQIRSGKL